MTATIVPFMLQFLRNTKWAILWGLLIIILTGIPGTVLPKLPAYFDLFQPDKLVHIFVFTVFFLLLAFSFRKPRTPDFVIRHPVVFSSLVCIVVAGTTELMQELLIPLRTGSVWDFTANMAGCLAGWGLLSLWKKDEGRETKDVRRKT